MFNLVSKTVFATVFFLMTTVRFGLGDFNAFEWTTVITLLMIFLAICEVSEVIKSTRR